MANSLQPTPLILSALCPELLLHIVSFLPPSSAASLSQTCFYLHSTLLPTIFSHLFLTFSTTSPKILPNRIHSLAELARNKPELCGLVRTASVELGTAHTLRFDDLMALGELLGHCGRLRRLRIVETWEPRR